MNMWVKSSLRNLLSFTIQSCYKKFSFFSDHPVLNNIIYNGDIAAPGCYFTIYARFPMHHAVLRMTSKLRTENVYKKTQPLVILT